MDRWVAEQAVLAASVLLADFSDPVWVETAGSEFEEGFLSRHPMFKKLKGKTFKKTKAGNARGSEAASFERGVVVLKPEFFKVLESYGEKSADHIFAHELGHSIESDTDWMKEATERGIDLWDASSLPLGSPNMDEAFAETFAVLAMKDSHGMGLLKKHPGWEELVRGIAERYGMRL